MCGIFFFNDTTYDQNDYEALKDAFASGSGRGPEMSRLTYIPQVDSWLGFHRLAINGLTPAADQPLYINDCILVCNGEIYNHRKLASQMNITLESGSDCEIIIHAFCRYGIEHTLAMLDGVFAFVLMDLRKYSNASVYVARDPFGVRPLYVSQAPKESAICIASELVQTTSSLQKFGLDVSTEQFPPGHWIELTKRPAVNVATGTYWGWTTMSHFNRYYSLPISGAARNYVLGDLSRTLVSAINKRVRNTERPVGCLLSGGLDSSLVAALVARESKTQIKTYSIGMPGSVDLHHAKIVADHIGSEHHEYLLSEQAFFDSIPAVIKAISSYDTTTVRASVGNYLVGSMIALNHADKVIFNGDGADEVMGGYLYVQAAGDCLEFDKECRRLVSDIHFFDVLRSDRCISTHGLEARTPFLDKQFVDTYLRLPPEMRYDSNRAHGEKYLLRHAIATSHPELLPDQVLWRKKEAFSDGVSSNNRSWFEIIRDKLEAMIPDSDMENLAHRYPYNTPQTKEQLYYRRVYEEHYPGTAEIVPYFWMPKYVDAKDSSARTLQLYQTDE